MIENINIMILSSTLASIATNLKYNSPSVGSSHSPSGVIYTGQGPQGSQGFQGPQSFQGPQGFQGSQGFQGPQGFRGATGLSTSDGAIGLQGFESSDPTITTTGSQGFQGIQGIQGLQGIQNQAGFQSSLSGNQGVQGQQGVYYASGIQGNQGNVGTMGYQNPITNDVFQIACNLLGSPSIASSLSCYPLSKIDTTYGLNSLGSLSIPSFVAIYIPQSTTITGVTWYQGTQGVYTSSSSNRIALYSYSSSTATLTATTAYVASDSLWTGASNTWISQAFVSSYAATAGIYYLIYTYNPNTTTTGPTIGRASNSFNNNFIPNQFYFKTPMTLCGGLNNISYSKSVGTLPTTINLSTSTMIGGSLYNAFFSLY